jgi:hypothetical protein
MTGAILVAQPVTPPGQVRAQGRHRKQPLHRKESAEQRFSAGGLISVGLVAAVVVTVLAFAGLIAKWSSEDSVPVADAGPPPSPAQAVPIRQPPAQAPPIDPPAPFPSDDKGFLDSSARCQGQQPAFAIGRTERSLVVICARQTGRYEYLGVRLSDAAVLRTEAETDSARGFLAQKAGVIYAVSPTELRVTTGNTVLKQEPMIEYHEVSR